MSLDTFYRYQELTKHGEIHTLINRSRRSPNLKNKTDIATEQTVVDYAIEYPVMNDSNWACLFQGVAFVLLVSRKKSHSLSEIFIHTDMYPEEITIRKARFTEHQIIAVLKSVEAGQLLQLESQIRRDGSF